jgi:hypothetical protein
MIEISISPEFADEYPGFMSGCAERGHRVQVIANRIAARDATVPPGGLGGPAGGRVLPRARRPAGGSSAGEGEGTVRRAAGDRP